jgi:hypothetical protein
MDSKKLEDLRRIFARTVDAFAAEPTAENFNRYRLASLTLNAARKLATGPAVTDSAVRYRRRGTGPGRSHLRNGR